MVIFRFFAVFSLLLMGAHTVYAQEATGSAPETADEKTFNPDPLGENEEENSEVSPEEQAKSDALTTKMGEMAKKLELNELQHFTTMIANYMILSTVNAVEDDVSEAVKGCAKNNPSIASDMEKRFKTWQENVAQPKKDAEANINNMMLAQTYVSQGEVKDIFSLVDETRAKNSSEFEKVPVTTPEACTYMLGKMDETEKSMSQILGTTLVSYPNLLQKNQE